MNETRYINIVSKAMYQFHQNIYLVNLDRFCLLLANLLLFKSNQIDADLRWKLEIFSDYSQQNRTEQAKSISILKLYNNILQQYMPNRMTTQMVKYSQEHISVLENALAVGKMCELLRWIHFKATTNKRCQYPLLSNEQNVNKTNRTKHGNSDTGTHSFHLESFFFSVVCIFLFVCLFGNKSQVNISSEHTNLWSFIFAHTNMVFRFIKPRTDHLEIGFIYSLLLLFFPLSLKQTENWISRKVKHVI